MQRPPARPLLTALACGAFVCGTARAQAPADTADGAGTTDEDEIAELRRAIAVRDQVIRNLIDRIERLETAVGTLAQATGRTRDIGQADGAEAGRAGDAEAATPEVVPGGAAAAESTGTDGSADSRARTAGEVPASPEAPETTEGAPALGTGSEPGTAAVADRAPPRASGAPAAAPTAAAVDDTALIRAAFERALIERGGLLLQPWQLELEPGLSYIHSSSEDLTVDGFTIFPVLVVGDIFSERVRRDTLSLNTTGRLGLPGRMQLDVRVPYVYEDQSRLTADAEETDLSDAGLGDVEIGLSRQLRRGMGRGPDLLGALRWKMRTGQDGFDLDENEIAFSSGFHSLSLSLTAMQISDPVVFFAGLSYTRNLEEHKPSGRFDPGDSYGLQIGMALALNLDTSINLGYQQTFTERTRIDGEKVAGSYLNTGTFSVGLSHVLSADWTVDANLAVGVSEDAPDLQLDLSVPLRWD